MKGLCSLSILVYERVRVLSLYKGLEFVQGSRVRVLSFIQVSQPGSTQKGTFFRLEEYTRVGIS